MMKRIFGVALLAALALSTVAHADAEWAGTTTANFLTLGTGAGILGRGGATLGLGGDVASVAWNVGGLGWMPQTEIGFSRTRRSRAGSARSRSRSRAGSTSGARSSGGLGPLPGRRQLRGP